MPITTPMEQVTKVGRFRLFRAEGRHFLHQGLHLWTGKHHVQLWPIFTFEWRLGRRTD